MTCVKIILEEVKCPLCGETMLIDDELGLNSIRMKNGELVAYDCICEKCDTKIILTTPKVLKQTIITKVK